MNGTQELTPKYWVGHDPKSDDVFLYTAAKSWDDTDKKLRQVCDNIEFKNL